MMADERPSQRKPHGNVGGVAVPLPIPGIVKDGFLITALSVVFFVWPLMALYGFGGGALLGWVNEVLHLKLAVPLVGVFMAAGMTATLPPMVMAASRTSSFILECVKWYLDHGEAEKAKSFARAVDYQVWYREWKRNPWFRRFVVENGLVETSAKYAKYNRRLPAE